VSTSEPGQTIRSYTRPVPATWWLRNRRYLLYMLRDFSPVPFTIWLVWWLVEINGLRAGPKGYHAHTGPLFVAFSAVCFLFALLHSFTFLNLSGVVLSIPLGPIKPSPTIIRMLNYSLWLGLSVIIAAGTIYLASLS
jgi:fumarate reductase subunit C